MISVYGGTRGPEDWGDQRDRMFRIIRISRSIRSFGAIRGLPGLPDHPEYPEPPGYIHRYWMAGLEILNERLMNTAWQANR